MKPLGVTSFIYTWDSAETGYRLSSEGPWRVFLRKDLSNPDAHFEITGCAPLPPSDHAARYRNGNRRFLRGYQDYLNPHSVVLLKRNKIVRVFPDKAAALIYMIRLLRGSIVMR